VAYLRGERLFGPDDPLFPATAMATGPDHRFRAAGLDRKGWSTATPIRRIFKEAFAKAGLPSFNPHSFRNTLAHLGQRLCRNPQDFKAWSQNLGHEQVLTTFTAYGKVSPEHQATIIRQLGAPNVEVTDAAGLILSLADQLAAGKIDLRRL
jgi:integrase/recombinase XerD